MCIGDGPVRAHVEADLDQGRVWPDLPLELNPGFEPGVLVDELVDAGLLHDKCRMIICVGVTRDEAEHILDSFPVVNREDTEQYGDLLTKRLVLEAFDRAAASMPATAEAG